MVGLAGAGLAGLIMMRLSRRVALFGFAGLQALSFIGWCKLGGRHPAAGGMDLGGGAVRTIGGRPVYGGAVCGDDGYCRAGHEGSDYTVQASVQLFAVGAFTLASGFSVGWLGYASHFLLAAILSAVVIIAAFFWQPPVVAHAPRGEP